MLYRVSPRLTVTVSGVLPPHKALKDISRTPPELNEHPAQKNITVNHTANFCSFSTTTTLFVAVCIYTLGIVMPIRLKFPYFYN